MFCFSPKTVLFCFLRIFGAFLFISQSAGFSHEKYEVITERTLRAGVRLDLSIYYQRRNYAGHQNWVKGVQQPFDQESSQSRFMVKGTLEILEVDLEKRYVKGSMNVEQLFWDDTAGEFGPNPNLDDVLEQSDKRIIIVWESTNIQISDSNIEGLSDRHKTCLSRMLSDVLQGSAEKRYAPEDACSIGDEWPVRTDELLTSELVAFGPHLGKLRLKKKIAGTVRLLERSSISGVDCMEFLAITEGSDCVEPFEELSSRISPIDVKETYRFLVPIDPKSLFKRSRRVREWMSKATSMKGDTRGLVSTRGVTERLETCIDEVEVGKNTDKQGVIE